MSHDTGFIAAQLSLLGQQMAAVTDELVLRTRHVVSDGQQKFEGMLLPHGVRFAFPPHVDISLRARILFLASGSNSSGIHMTRADDGSRRKESAKPGMAECMVENIMRGEKSVPAVRICAQRKYEMCEEEDAEERP